MVVLVVRIDVRDKTSSELALICRQLTSSGRVDTTRHVFRKGRSVRM